ncbi:gliding motility-associated C-terminal domain-containing protein [Flavobacterium sp. AC]|uniref:Gliding motility-associated C-terminal domain-containing protein n=1 Tax=Flavobacterium azizsancarii TaxID=2961580 RepID=A0ABT4WD37_9FLAO|nr:gliding motility-associated C-terminal domain-containing protein [Flavobacterium azizsancarii]MDA6070392.1 gliding motility-associated C-terminal domain-containing protein [Flavobacterium azizsancarii]
MKNFTFFLNNKKKIIYCMLLFLLHLSLQAQEICNNGLDDNGNGYVDQYDPQCYTTLAPTCFVPAPAPNFKIDLALQGPPNTLDVSISPTIGDLDGDGIPEIIAPLGNSTTGYMTYHVIGGAIVDAGINFRISLYQPVSGTVVQPAIADIDRDGKAEVISVDVNGYVYVFGHTGGNATTYKFKSDLPSTVIYGSPRIADIDEDGVPEIIVGHNIFKFDLINKTLKRFTSLPTSRPHGKDTGSWGADIVVVDILPSNPGKEIVAGGTVYGVNMTTGVLTVLRSLNAINSSIALNIDGPTAVADLNLDGNLDIVFSNGGRVYVWDPVANQILLNIATVGSAARQSMPTISYMYDEVANDGMSKDFPEILIGYTNKIVAYNLQIPGNVVWSLATTDSSGETGITSFDFNGDAIQELVYNDETQVRIIDGNTRTPVNLATFSSGTLTWMEHPVIADIDNDGQAEIIAFTGLPRAASGEGRLNIFKAGAGSSWQPARKVWNQRGYRVVNINDDLTVTRQETKMSNFMPVNSTKYRILNQYNVQLNPINLVLEPGTVAATDVQLKSVKHYNVPKGELTLEVSVLGASDLPAGSPVTVYNGNPTTTAATIVGTGYTTEVIASGTTKTITITIPSYQSYKLFAVVNDNGSVQTPFDLGSDFPSTGLVECDYENNIASIPVQVTDTDGDGKDDGVDLDADNDGILDTDESHGYDIFGDEDGDGILNFQDVSKGPGPGDGSKTDYTDVNGDGIADVFDTDGDGIIDAFDLDSDNDGCPDSNEYYNDPNADGGDGGQYGLGPDPVATKPDGTVLNPMATYTGTLVPVYTALKITVNVLMPDQTVNIGDTAIFSSAISATKVSNFYTNPKTVADVTNELTYQWYVSKDDGIIFTALQEEVNSKLELTDVQLVSNKNLYKIITTHPDSNAGCVITTDQALLTVTQSPKIALVKTSNVSNTVAVGDLITYTFTVTNTGDVILSAVVVDDAMTGSANLTTSPSSLVPGATGTATATYTIKQSDIDNGSVSNSAVATGTAPDNKKVSDTSGTSDSNDDATETTLTQTPKIAVVKTSSVGGTGAVGDVITYTFSVKNTGNVTLSAVVVDDAMTGSSNLATSPSSLVPGATGTATATYTIKQSDIDNGSVSNSAVATGTAPDNKKVSDTSGTSDSNDDATETTLTQTPKIAVVKTSSVGGTGAVGDVITYSFTVTNTGNVTLSAVVVDDTMTGSANLTTSPSSLAPGATGTATATYTIKQSDLDKGSVSNSAVATGTAPDNATVNDTSGTSDSNDDATETSLRQTPKIALVKTSTIGGTGAVGDVITYSFTVTNTGNVTLSAVVVDDTMTGSANLTTSPSSLAPGATGTATATYTIKQSDLDNGSVSNSAVATGTAPDNATVNDTSGTSDTNDDPTETSLRQAPKIALVKTSSVGGTGAVDDVITYSFTVTNTGNVTLSAVVVDDAMTGSANLTTSPSSLAPGATGTATATYTIKQSDIDNGSVSNSAVATGTAPDNATVNDTSGTSDTNDDPTETSLRQAPKIALVKTSSVGGTGAVGDVITYTFSVKNTGNVTLSAVVVDDAMTGSANLTTSPSSLVPGATGTATATYTIKQSDIDNGSVSNSAVATGTAPDNATVSDTSGTSDSNDDPTETSLRQAPKIALVKTSTIGGTGAVGDVITYSFTVTNTGNVTLSAVVVDDTMTGSANLITSPSSLAPGATGTATATYTIKQSDLDNGSVSNSAVATGTAPDNATVNDTSGTSDTNDDPTETALRQAPKIALVKTSTIGGTGAVGDVITYSFTVTNTGNVTLSAVVVDDTMTGSANLTTSPSSLAPGATGTATATYTIKQSDLDKGSVSNSAVATGTAPDNATVNDTSGTSDSNDDPTETSLRQAPKIALVKTSTIGGTGAVGDVITYSFTVTNTGNVTLSAVVVDDAMTGSANLTTSPSSLAPGATGTATATYTIKQSDIDNGSVSNSAVATGTAPDNATVNDTSGTSDTNDDPTETALRQAPKIALVKTSSVGGTGAVGDVITYTFSVKNTGNVTLSAVVVDDAMTGSANLTTSPSSLVPGATGTATATYTIKQSDIDNGSVSNSAVATGTAPDNATVNDTSGTSDSNDDATETTLTQTPKIAVVKTSSVGGTGAVGDVITYTFSVKNTGNVTLSAVVVDDAMTGSANLTTSPSSLVPGATGTATATYTIKQSDIDNGSVSNSAVATGTAPDNATVSDTSGTSDSNDDPTETKLSQEPGLKLYKMGTYHDTDKDGTVNVGDRIDYIFKVINTGNVTISNIKVSDPMVAVSGGPISSLSPAVIDATTYTASYTMTQADIDLGAVYNLAFVSGKDTNGNDIENDSQDEAPLTPKDKFYETTCPKCTVTTLEQKSSIALIKTAIFNDANNNGSADAGETISYSFTVINTGNVRLKEVTIKDPLPGIEMTGGPISLSPGETDSTTFKGVYVLKQSDINAKNVSNQAIVTAVNPLGITVRDASDDNNIDGDNPTVLAIEGCIIKVFNAISPNGDSKNERFYIQGLECYPENTIEIYNRWGVLVFERDHYNNEERAFRGMSEGRTTVKKSDGLPVGTYYYILKYKDSDSNGHQEAGYLYLNR